MPSPIRYVLLAMLFLFCGLGASAQNSSKVKALQKQKAELQQALKKSRGQLDDTRKKLKSGEKNIKYLDMQLADRLKHIRKLEDELNQLDKNLQKQERNIRRTKSELQAKREKLKKALRYARFQRQKQHPLLFVISAPTVSQIYRRARYAKEYALYEQTLAEQILQKQVRLLKGQDQLLKTKSKQNDLLHEVMDQRSRLSAQQIKERREVSGLKKKESGLAAKVKEHQKQLNALDKKIDQLIAYEIEQARKRAEAEARRKAEANKKGGSSKPSSSKSAGGWLTAEEKKLSGTFRQNKGRLPVPITGRYMISGRFGKYNVSGLKNVTLENKGTNYVGQSGARARSVFDGVVTQVFQFGGTKNVLVRHGSYISVYCNLSSVTVQKGQKVRARDILGTVARDETGQCVLHFQLRQETTKLNPESWIGK